VRPGRDPTGEARKPVDQRESSPISGAVRRSAFHAVIVDEHCIRTTALLWLSCRGDRWHATGLDARSARGIRGCRSSAWSARYRSRSRRRGILSWHFCNGDDDGIVVGVSTTKIDRPDVVDKRTPLDFKPSEAFRYRQLIDQYLYPPVVGLNVAAVPTGDGSGMFMLIEIPSHPNYNKLYLVHGAMVGEKLYGAFIGVARPSTEKTFDAASARESSVAIGGVGTRSCSARQCSRRLRPHIRQTRRNITD
jgi:hypothetical protein